MAKDAFIFEILTNKSTSEILQTFEQIIDWDLELVNEQGQSPLHVAVMHNQVAVVAYLLGKGYRPSQRDQTQLSPFIAAAANGFKAVFELMLPFSPELAQVNRFGGTALHPSAEKGFLPVVESALAAGVPPDEKNRLSWTPLLEAVILGDEGFLYQDVILALLDYQADASMTDDFQMSSIDYAEQLGHQKITAILKEKGREDVFTVIRQLLREGKITTAIAQLSQMPGNLGVWYYLGYAYEALGSDDSATFYYQKGLEQDIEFSYYLANLAKRQGNRDQARHYFEQGIDQSINKTFYRYHYSNFLREIGAHEEAIAIMDQLLAADPTRVDYLFHKANSYRSLAMHQDAYDTMIEAQRIQPKNPLYGEHAQQSKDLIERKR